MVDAVREGQGHAGSTPATSTNLAGAFATGFVWGSMKLRRRRIVVTNVHPAIHADSPLKSSYVPAGQL